MNKCVVELCNSADSDREPSKLLLMVCPWAYTSLIDRPLRSQPSAAPNSRASEKAAAKRMPLHMAPHPTAAGAFGSRGESLETFFSVWNKRPDDTSWKQIGSIAGKKFVNPNTWPLAEWAMYQVFAHRSSGTSECSEPITVFFEGQEQGPETLQVAA